MTKNFDIVGKQSEITHIQKGSPQIIGKIRDKFYKLKSLISKQWVEEQYNRDEKLSEDERPK